MNNGPDELWNYLKGFSDPRIKLSRNIVGGLPFNLNYGVNLSQGSLIARMDADDVCHLQRLEKQVAYYNDYTEVSVLGTGYQEINENGQTGIFYVPQVTNEKIRQEMLWTCSIVHPTVMFKKDIFLKFMGYQFSLYAEDYDLWLRMMHNPEVIFANIPESLFLYRIHGGQSSNAALIQRNFAVVLSLMMREFFLTKNPILLCSIFKRWIWSKIKN